MAPGENLIIKLFIDGVVGTSLVDFILEDIFKESAGYIVMFEHCQHDFQEVILYHHQF